MHIFGDQSFLDFGSGLPDRASGFLDSSRTKEGAEEGLGLLSGTATPLESQEEKKTKRIKMSKGMKKSMEKMKKRASELPLLWFHNQAKEHPEWELDDEEKELMTDSIGVVFDVLDIEFQIEPLSWTLTSIYWVLSYPIFAFLFLFLTKKSLMPDEEPPTDA